MTPAPLPPEEIERLKTLLADATKYRTGLGYNGQHVNALGFWLIGNAPALLAEIEAGRAEIQGYRDWADDAKRLTRLIDVEMNDEDGAAKQASLCDLVGSATLLRQQIKAGRAGAERVRDDALAEAEALAEKFAKDNGMRSDDDIRGAAREQAAEDIAAGIAALRQAAPPATRADLAQVGAQPAGRVRSDTEGAVYLLLEDFAARMPKRRMPAEDQLNALAETIVNTCLGPATPPTSGAGDEGEV